MGSKNGDVEPQSNFFFLSYLLSLQIIFISFAVAADSRTEDAASARRRLVFKKKKKKKESKLTVTLI